MGKEKYQKKTKNQEKRKHQPTQSARFYPGAFMSPERAARVLSMDVSIDELTVDDIVFGLTNVALGNYHTLLQIVHDEWGPEAAKKVAYQFGFRAGTRSYQAQLDKWKTKSLTPEQMCIYQDIVHVILGCPHCLSTYDDEKVIVQRSKCNLYNPSAPEAVRNLCLHTDKGYLDAYMQVDPKIKPTLFEALPKGDAFCRHIFRFEK